VGVFWWPGPGKPPQYLESSQYLNPSKSQARAVILISPDWCYQVDDEQIVGIQEEAHTVMCQFGSRKAALGATDPQMAYSFKSPLVMTRPKPVALACWYCSYSSWMQCQLAEARWMH